VDILKLLIKKRILNNQWVNPLFKILRLDAFLNDYVQDYVDYMPDHTKSLQEIAGYSNKSEVNQALQSVQRKLMEVFHENFNGIKPEEIQILDIGCGPGLFLKNFEKKATLTGIDISESMCKIARKELPSATIICGHFLKYPFSKRYNYIYSVGVLIYFSRSQLADYFSKIQKLAAQQAIIFISYPHAFRKSDLVYHDYTYVHYSPDYLNELVSEEFEILYHKHQNGERIINDYDRNPLIKAENFDNRSYYNSSILILKKK
jgi:cyclopropane fatty-acyl-phospholipid synthase-like methyltransferase